MYSEEGNLKPYTELDFLKAIHKEGKIFKEQRNNFGVFAKQM